MTGAAAIVNHESTHHRQRSAAHSSFPQFLPVHIEKSHEGANRGRHRG
jgi:hypothetical protein